MRLGSISQDVHSNVDKHISNCEGRVTDEPVLKQTASHSLVIFLLYLYRIYSLVSNGSTVWHSTALLSKSPNSQSFVAQTERLQIGGLHIFLS